MRLAITAIAVFVAGVSAAPGANAPTVRGCVTAWNLPRNGHAQGVLRRDGERGAYLDVAALEDGTVTNHACQFVAVGGRIPVIVSGTWANGTVKRWSVHTFPQQLPRPTANQLNTRVLRSGKLALR